MRKSFSVSERVAIAKAISEGLGKKYSKPKCKNFTVLQGRKLDIAAEKAGFGNRVSVVKLEKWLMKEHLSQY